MYTLDRSCPHQQQISLRPITLEALQARRVDLAGLEAAGLELASVQEVFFPSMFVEDILKWGKRIGKQKSICSRCEALVKS